MSTSPAFSYILAVARETYRGILIWQTGTDVRIFVGTKEYNFVNDGEAKAFVDAAYAAIIIDERKGLQ